jgi:exodeoxyribonuclease VII large subunit
VPDLRRAIRSFRGLDIDVLVIIRGGGSLESLQAYNNETLVREIAAFPRPVICGIGHDKDVPLASLAADIAVSTPTAVTRELNRSWERSREQLVYHEREILIAFRDNLAHTAASTERSFSAIRTRFAAILAQFRDRERAFLGRVFYLHRYAAQKRARLGETAAGMARLLSRQVLTLRERLAATGAETLVGAFAARLRETLVLVEHMERALTLSDPSRQLRLGYSITFKGGRVVKGARDLEKGDEVAVRFQDGIISAEVTDTRTDTRDEQSEQK